MYIIECLPLVKTFGLESLSYFSSKPFESGSLVKIELRKKHVPALVLESRMASESKAEIKSASFVIKKISAFGSGPFLRKEFLEGTKKLADYFATNQGAILRQLIPLTILQNPKLLSLSKQKQAESKREKLRYDVEALQADSEERVSHYKAIIRESFAKKKSVFLCLSQNEDIRDMQSKLSRGIEHFTCIFHDLQSPKEFKENLKNALDSEHPILIVATASWLFLPRKDVGTIIIEGENKPGWKTLSRPFIDMRTCAETLAKSIGAVSIIGDTFLRVETLYRYKEQEIGGENIKWRGSKEIRSKLIDSEESVKKDKGWRPLSSELAFEITGALAQNGNVFIYASRKGLSSTIVCRDCGTRVSCNNCAAPMILYKTKSGSVFRCHQCSEVRGAEELCRNCNSWNLITLGAGVDKITEAVRESFPDLQAEGKIFELHRDIASTSAKATRIIEQFEKERGAILIGTEMALSYLRKRVHTSVIAAIDSLFAVPDFKIREKIFRLILEINYLAQENFVMQSRNKSDATVELAIGGNLIDFYRLEIADREALSYPPFSIFIKVTMRGTKSFVSKELEHLRQVLAPWEPAIFASIHEKKGAQAAVNAVLKVPHHKYPEARLIATLRSLPLHFEIRISPDNLL